MFFTKGHGTANDFVILPDPDGELELTPALVAALCDRRRGIGGDGVLRVVRAAKHPEGAAHAAEAEWFMDYWNSDGSIAEMCGNGVRVFARYLVENGLATADPAGLPVATRAGVMLAVVRTDTISVRMSTPRVYAASTATVGALTVPGLAVDCGNPHLVCGLHDGVELGGLDLTVAPLVDTALFTAGVNVEFVEPAAAVTGVDRHVRMRVHERGSGETQSCGTGALAVGAVALREAGLERGSVAVDVLGGRLVITCDERGAWWLAGPAVLVASGEVDPAVFAAAAAPAVSG
ncbi:diaminopimelate epimerase [Actinoplanes ianthinogenes]|uniref:diaminopimelate epimerase n=1 Tax=Actinoplanes ianthinogenes TaxID=122358 RepID=UPI001670F5B3|nr:diaminopimelate epimerase [Actinoplanes ianthinogenes]